MDIQDVLLKIGYSDLKDFGKEWRTRPLYRASDNTTSLCIKKATGEWYDFSGRMGGGLAQLVQKTLSLGTIEEAKTIMGDVEIVTYKDHRYELTATKKFDKGLLLKLRRDHSYWIGRKVSEDTVAKFMGGVTYNGRMAYRYVFPIFDEREDLVGFSGRALKDNPDYPKWKHLGAKSNWCYPLRWNADAIAKTREVVLLESIGDMLSLWDAGIRNTMVTFGVDISTQVIQALLKRDVQRILIGFNNDADNNMVGNQAAEEGRQKLSQYFDEHQIVIALPDSKDFGEMNEEKIRLWQTKHQLKS